jgi:hypothetical protein
MDPHGIEYALFVDIFRIGEMNLVFKVYTVGFTLSF